MADLKITSLPALAEAGIQATDVLALADLSAAETKKVTVKDLVAAAVALLDAGDIPASKVGTLGTNQVSSGALADGSVTNAKLANSSISLGGISIALGATDATPAFNLADATGYTTANLSGTISNAQLTGSITGDKLSNTTVTYAKLNLADGDISGAKITGNSITNAQIGADAVGSSELANNAVDTAAIVNSAVTNAKLANASISLGGLTLALGSTDATPALDLTDATNYPATSLSGTITNAQLAGSITGDKLANTTIAYGKLNLADGSVPGAKITGNSITAAQIGANAVTASELADDAVDTAAVVNAAITGAKIATDTITAGNIAANAVGASELANNAVDTAAVVDGAITTDKIADGAITTAKLDGTIAASSIADNSVTSAKIAANAVGASELADNSVDTDAIQNAAVTDIKISAVSGGKILNGTIDAAALDTTKIDRSLNVASGKLGINNTITAATRSGITYNSQGLITASAALGASDLPIATASAVGGVSVGTGLSVSGAGALSLSNSVTGSTVSGITFNNQGQITAATALTSAMLPVATTSAKGAVQITSGGGLTVDGAGNLITSTSGVSAGTYQSVTVNDKGAVTAGAALTASLIPSLAASKITSGSFDAARIANDSIDGTKLSNASTAIFQSIAQSGYPTAQFNGQILFDTVSEDAFIWDGNAWQAITTLTKGSLVFGGTYNATTSKMVSTTSAGIAAGLAVGSNLPTPSATTDGVYVVVDTAGTPAAPAPVVAFSPPDYILGVTNSAGSSWNEIDLSQTVAGQVASNITFTPYGQLSSTNLQDVIEEVETEKLAKAGGTISGELLIGNSGSLVFEGSTVDAFETTITVADPTSSDKTITFPDTTGTVITSGDTNTVTSTMVDASLVNANLAANASIAFSKLAALTSAQILVGNGSNVATAVAVTGDIGINNAGLTSITAGAIVNADVSSTAAITGSKITTGTTSAVGVLQLTDSTSSTSTTTAATPNAVKAAYDLANTANTTGNAALPKAGGTMTGNLILDNAKELRLSESDSDGAHFSGFKAQAQSADITYTLPATAPTTGQVLKAGSTATTLEWATDVTNTAAGDLTGTTLASNVVASSLTSVGTLTSLNVSGTITGNVTGNCSGTATSLATARAINGVDFDGSADITVTAAAGTLSGATLASGVTASSLTSVGTLTGLTTSGDINLNAQSDLRFKDADSSHYVALQSPASVASSFTLTLPSADAAVSGYVLASDGAGTLSWVDPGSTSSPTFTGDVSLTNDGALVGFSNLNATYTGNVKTLTVTVASKTAAHRYYGSGSSSGYKIDGKESPFLTLTPGRTYKFDQSHSSNSGHPLVFYEIATGTSYTTGVTTSGTPGSSGAYTQIVVSDTTPQVLHYQCSNHSYMGNAVQTNSNVAYRSRNVEVTAQNNVAATVYPLFAGNGATATGYLTAATDTGFTYNSSSGDLTATKFTGSGASLTNLNATSLASGTVAAARLGSGSSITTKFLRGDNTWQAVSSTPEGTSILSTGEGGATKFLREDGDGTCSWQAITGFMPSGGGSFSGDVSFTGTSSDLVWYKSTFSGLDDVLNFKDETTASFGSSHDLKIYYSNGDTTSYLHAPDGVIKIKADEFQLVSDDSNGRAIYLDNPNNRLELGFDGGHDAWFTGSGVEFIQDVKFDGATTGRDITFDRSANSLIFASEAKAQFNTSTLFHNGTDLYVQNGTGDIRLEVNSGDSGLWMHRDGSIELYDGNAVGVAQKKFNTTETGADITGGLNINHGTANTLMPLIIDGSGGGGTKIELKGASEPRITYYEGTTLKAYLLWHSTAGDFMIQNAEHSNILAVGTTPKWSVNNGVSWSEMLHQSNVGSGGALASSAIHAASLTLSGDLTVNGTTTTINTATLDVEDKNITLGKVSSPSDATADGGGLTLKGATDKTFNWVDSTDAWTSSEHIKVASGKTFIGSGANLTSLPAAQLTGTLPAISGANLTNVNATTLDSIDSGSFLRSDAADTMSAQLTLTNAGQYPLNINNSNDGKIVLQGSSNPYIYFNEGTSGKAYFQWNSAGYLEICNNEDGSRIHVKDDISFSYEGSTYYSMVHQGNVGSSGALSSSTVYMNKLYLANGTAIHSSGWMEFTSNTYGLYWNGGSAHNFHLHPTGVNYMRVRSGSSTGVGLDMNTAGTTRGYFYANSSNEIGVLTSGGSWILRCNSSKETAFFGAVYPYANNSYNLGTSGYKWANVHATAFHGDGSNLTNLPSTGGSTPTVKTSSYTASNGDLVVVNGTSLTITLPSSPSTGDTVSVRVLGSNFCNIARNGQKIEEQTEDLYVDTYDGCANLIYVDSTRGWLIAC